MRVLVTGAAGHLGEALMRRLPQLGHEVVGLDVEPGPFVDHVASVTDAAAVREAVAGAEGVVHAATLHKPHVTAGFPRAAFVDVNVTGTLTLLEAAAAAGVGAFVFTSSTTTFGRALSPAPGEPAAWIDETVVPRPKNVYGATKVAAEDLCELVHRDHGLPVVVLRTSRFFPEDDDDPARRATMPGEALRLAELLHRRVDLDDVVTAHDLALRRAPALGFRRLVVSATTPLQRADAAELATDLPGVVARRCGPQAAAVLAERGWSLPPSIDRVYDNAAARAALGWAPRWSFGHAVAELAAGRAPVSELTRLVGSKGYGGVDRTPPAPGSG